MIWIEEIWYFIGWYNSGTNYSISACKCSSNNLCCNNWIRRNNTKCTYNCCRSDTALGGRKATFGILQCCCLFVIWIWKGVFGFERIRQFSRYAYEGFESHLSDFFESYFLTSVEIVIHFGFISNINSFSHTLFSRQNVGILPRNFLIWNLYLGILLWCDDVQRLVVITEEGHESVKAWWKMKTGKNGS